VPFDPNAPARVTSGRQRGSRWRLLAGVAVVVGCGAIVAQQWVASLFRSHPAAARPDVIPVQAEPAVFVPAQIQPPAPPPAPPPKEQPPKVQARPAAAAPRLPTRIAWDAKPSGEPDMAWFRDGRRPMLAKGCALRPGATVIKAALVTAVASEVAGQAVAQVTEDVYDADGVGRLLIPQGTRVVGVYKSARAMTFDRERLDFGWTEMTLPDGTQIDLGQADGADASGAAGVGGEVTTPWGNVIATAALLSVFDAMATVPAATTGDPVANAIATSVGRSTSDVGREVTRRSLGIEPKISIPAGTPVTIWPRQTVRVCG
jgi:type IV secretory pathway VirB10-like protein